MTGVEILAMKEVVVAYEFSWIIYVGVIIVMAIVMGCIGYFTTKHPTTSDALLGMLIGALVGAALGLLPASCCIPSEYEVRYKVTISDEVQMNDFLSRYEIISTEGKIYTVKEISND